MKILNLISEKHDTIYYHGTNSNFSKFDVNKLGTEGNDEYGPGIYFVNNPEFAKDFGENVHKVTFHNVNLITENQPVNINELIKFMNFVPREYVDSFVENYGGDSNNPNSVKEIIRENFNGIDKQDAFLELWGHSMLNFNSRIFYNAMLKLGYDGMMFSRGTDTIVTIYNDSKIQQV